MIIFNVSCSTKNPFKDSISESIKKNGMGVDLKPDIKEIIIIDTITVKESIDDWYNFNKEHNEPLDSVIYGVSKVVIDLEKIVDPNESEKFDSKIWRYKLDRINNLTKLSKQDIDYFVVECIYTINNPILNNAQVTIDNIYLIDKDFKVILKKDKEDFEKIANENNKTPLVKYEILFLEN